MAKQRFINTKLWSDSWIRKLNPLDRFLFLYFLTNEHTNICGIYEVALETVAFETGIELDTLSKSMLHRLEPKVFYIDGWVCITNFEKHQRGRGNDKIARGIINAKAEIPKQILDKLAEKSSKKRYSIHSVSRSTDYSDIDIDRDKDTAPSAGKLGNEIIYLFKDINPSYESLYKRKNQHSAAERLLAIHGFEQIKKVIEFIASRRADQYCPTITTPSQLEDKWAALEKYAEGLKSSIKNKQRIWV